MPYSSPTPSILIVEDDPQLCENMALILSLEGFDVRTAPNGQEALEMVKEKQPDLILCDILMPKLDGCAFHEHIKRHPSWAAILFIFVSALNERNHIRRGMLSGADDYLPKPFTADELLSAVNARLERRRSLHLPIQEMKDIRVAEGVTEEQIALLQRISRREREVLLLVGQGVTTKEIAARLFISPKTVEAHRSQLMKKLNANNAAALARWAALLEIWTDPSS